MAFAPRQRRGNKRTVAAVNKENSRRKIGSKSDNFSSTTYNNVIRKQSEDYVHVRIAESRHLVTLGAFEAARVLLQGLLPRNETSIPFHRQLSLLEKNKSVQEGSISSNKIVLAALAAVEEAETCRQQERQQDSESHRHSDIFILQIESKDGEENAQNPQSEPDVKNIGIEATQVGHETFKSSVPIIKYSTDNINNTLSEEEEGKECKTVSTEEYQCLTSTQEAREIPHDVATAPASDPKATCDSSTLVSTSASSYLESSGGNCPENIKTSKANTAIGENDVSLQSPLQHYLGFEAAAAAAVDGYLSELDSEGGTPMRDPTRTPFCYSGSSNTRLNSRTSQSSTSSFSSAKKASVAKTISQSCTSTKGIFSPPQRRNIITSPTQLPLSGNKPKRLQPTLREGQDQSSRTPTGLQAKPRRRVTVRTQPSLHSSATMPSSNQNTSKNGIVGQNQISRTTTDDVVALAGETGIFSDSDEENISS